MASGDGSAGSNDVKKNEKDELILYLHNYSFYSQKIMLLLNEKGIQFQQYFVNIAGGDQYTPTYLKINPKGEVPVLKDGEKIIIDSANIITYLEENSSKEGWPTLTPLDEGAAVIERHNHFHTLIHDLPADVITIGSFYHQNLVRRPKMPFLLPTRIHMRNITERIPAKLRKLAEEYPEFAAELKKKADRIEEDLKKMKDPEEFQKVLDTVDGVLQEVEEQLANNQEDGRWLVSMKFTIADIDLAILLERLNQLGLEEKFWGNKPHVKGYFTRVKQRESYRKSMPTTAFHIKTFLKAVTYLQLF